ncbi:MAG: hypothetical protein IPK71_09080 [Myxococcales bacterium]|nr:hypothetical protein [Myxococcales bacterium]
MDAPLRSALAAAFVSAVVLACGGGVGAEGTAVGGPCAANADCASTSRCITSGSYPQGMCVVNCNRDVDCPTGSRCVDKDSGVCLPECTRNDECRANYECKDESTRDGGKALVCRKD